MRRLLRRSRLLLWAVRAVRYNVTYPAARSAIFRAYFRRETVKKLHLGAGPDFVLEGWLNTDINPCYRRGVAYLDARGPFPFPDEVFDYVHSEHLIEHLTLEEGRRMLRECLRVLRPGGKLRTATPDLQVYVDLFGERTELEERYIRYHVDKFVPEAGFYGPALVVNNELRSWGHKFVYDRETLGRVLAEAGFERVTERRVGESDDQALRGIELHGSVVGDEEMNAFETMVMEATRPACGAEAPAARRGPA